METTKKNYSAQASMTFPPQDTEGSQEQESQDLEDTLEKPKHTSDSIRLAYYTLLAASLKHRDLFIGDEVQAIKDAPEPTAEQALRSIPGSQGKGLKQMNTKTARKIHKESTEVMVKKILHLKKSMDEEVSKVKAKMTPSVKSSFETTVDYLCDSVEELLFARNIQEAVGLLKLYNAGQLDLLFENSRKLANEQAIKENEKTTTEPQP